jgi:hypothetical protein
VYELTEYGSGLEEVVHAIARWGARSLGPPRREDDLDHEWGLSAFPALFYPERARGLTETYVVRVDGDVFTVRVVDGHLRSTELGATAPADVELSTDIATFFALASGDLPPLEALEQGRVEVEGDPEALVRCFRVFSFAPRLLTPRAGAGQAAAADEARLGPRTSSRAAAESLPR